MGKLLKLLILTSSVFLGLFTSVVWAEEWVASKMRGAVFMYENAEWQQIFRGHRVDSSNAIQTAPGARVVFTRGKESIDVRGDTRIRIKDRVGALNTVIEQDFGEINVDVEKKNVQHFAVKAPLLTAVVKGTRFTVKSDRSGAAAEVIVRRGRVEVQDNQLKVKVDVKSGQRAGREAGVSAVIEVKGRGKVEPFISMNSNQPVANNSAELKQKLGISDGRDTGSDAVSAGASASGGKVPVNVGNGGAPSDVGGVPDIGTGGSGSIPDVGSGSSSSGASSGAGSSGGSSAGSSGSGGSGSGAGGSGSSGSGSSGSGGSGGGSSSKGVVGSVTDKVKDVTGGLGL
ncbi:FecR family protein [Maritalea mobilis]|uniref:FecR family protein n=1 Tax=Maritalea mobilis TaxID=483324 RepID=A0A4R6VRR4_9HYPH|nr:FecR family protein [Maritalea mobilis]TDQ66722.1 FecR family protein [Maritalea mobilis]